MLRFPMPFRSVPCSIWLPTWVGPDEYGNTVLEYGIEPDVETRCCYAPGYRKPDTSDDIEEGRPYGDRATMTFFLPKDVDADLRMALIACYPPDDSVVSGKVFRVVGEPYSYPRANTPGDYSWAVEAVRFDG